MLSAGVPPAAMKVVAKNRYTGILSECVIETR